MVNQLILISLLLSSACSFKSPENKDKSIVTVDYSKIDTDGDLINDSLDAEPYLANVPLFDGEMMEEIKVTSVFYNRALNQVKETELIVKSSDEELVLKKGGSFVKNLIEDNAVLATSSVNNLMLPLSETDLNLYSAPIITDEVAHNYMGTSYELKTQGFVLDAVEFELRNRINLKSDRFKSFRDIILDVYSYDYQTKKLEFLDSFKNTGSFEFNKDHLLDIANIKTRNTRVMDNSVLKAGKFLYVKIKDYYIPELNQNFSDLMKNVKKHTTPVVVNSPDGFDIYYVGTNGSPTKIQDLLLKSLKNYETGEGKFIKYKDYPVGEYRIETSSGERENILSKWYIATNEINNNPFSYSFFPTDIVALNYSKSNDPIFIAKNVVSSLSDTEKELVLTGEGLVPAKTRKIKVILSSIIAKEPYLESSYSEKAGWGNGTCGPEKNHTGNVVYKHTWVNFKNVPIFSNDSRFEDILKYSVIEIDGFEYPLKKLIEEKKFSVHVDNDNKLILESQDSFLKSLKGFGAESVRFSMLHKRQFKNIETGKYLHNCKCAQIGGPNYHEIGCRDVQDRGHTEMKTVPLNYSFYTSIFVF